MGTLLSFSLLSLAKETVNCDGLDETDIVRFPDIIAKTISIKGKAKIGDKTILDALVPFAETISAVYEETGNFRKAYSRAVDAAEKGMEDTRGMTARIGRAKWLDGRNKEYPDGGAVLCVRILRTLEKDFCMKERIHDNT